MTLEFVEPQEIATWNALLYGPGKSGKSVAAASAPGPVLYCNAESQSALRVPRAMHPNLKEVALDKLSAMLDVIAHLREGKHSFKTVAVDPVGELYTHLVYELSGGSLSPRLDVYRDAGTHIERFARNLCALPINVVFVAHDHVFDTSSEGDSERLPYTGSNSNPSLGGKLLQMVDIVGFTGVVREDDKTVYKAQLINGYGRRGGSRFPVLGASRELDLTEWSDRINESIAAEGSQKEAKAA